MGFETSDLGEHLVFGQDAELLFIPLWPIISFFLLPILTERTPPEKNRKFSCVLGILGAEITLSCAFFGLPSFARSESDLPTKDDRLRRFVLSSLR